MIHSHKNIRQRRSGMIYLLMLGMAMLIAIMVSGALIISRVTARKNAMASNGLNAEALAETAIEYALTKINTPTTGPTWRATNTSAVEGTPVPFNGGTISYIIKDEITNHLTSTTTNPIRIYGIGRYQGSKKIYSVRCQGEKPLTCLNAALCVGGNFAPTQSHSITGPDFTLATNGTFNGNVAGSGSPYLADLEAVGSITLDKVNVAGFTSTGVVARDMPPSNAFESYIAQGTTITFSSIPSGIIQNVLISPSSNPYGTKTNSKGIYIIDCGGLNISITRCRIVGTLVILNPGSACVIGSNTLGLNWSPAVPNYPCLMFNGNCTFSVGKDAVTPLSESTSPATNFNPAGTPYPYYGGTTNATSTDTYPVAINGLVYISGNVTGNVGYYSIDQLIIGGTYNPSKDTITFTYDTIPSSKPPPGFGGAGNMVPIPGTWRWEKF